jgi:hypothetical protein
MQFIWEIVHDSSRIAMSTRTAFIVDEEAALYAIAAEKFKANGFRK